MPGCGNLHPGAGTLQARVPAGVCTKQSSPPPGPRRWGCEGDARLEPGAPSTRWSGRAPAGCGSHAPTLCTFLSGSSFPGIPSFPECLSATSAFAGCGGGRAAASGKRSPKLFCHLLAARGGDAGRSRAGGIRQAWLPNAGLELLMTSLRPPLCSAKAHRLADPQLSPEAPLSWSSYISWAASVAPELPRPGI